MRVISGVLKGRKIKGYDIDGTRPTMDRVKESIFGSIQGYVRDSIVLDLFAGSGNLGIEAISNGCKVCYFVDNNKKCVRCIDDNVSEFGIRDRAIVMRMDYRDSLEMFCKEGIGFDIIFVDPPYKYESINEIVGELDYFKVVREGGILVLEFKYDNVVVDNDKYFLLKNKKYGDKYVYIYKRV